MMSNDVQIPVHPVHPAGPASISLGRVIPTPVLAFCALMILIGAILMLTRASRLESSAMTAIENCEASTFKPFDRDRKPQPIEDGLNEMYGLVQFKNNKAELARLFSYCDTDPQIALNVYRRAMNGSNVNAKSVAAYSSFFLANRGVFDASDFELLRKCIDKSQPMELRKVAQRAISDLTVIKTLKETGKYEEIPPMVPRGADEPSRQIKTDKQKLNGQDVLCVRWSSADVADAWWTAQAAKGAWDPQMKRFVIP